MAKKVAFAAKSRVNHERYGAGTITDMNSHHTTIHFDDHGSKKFVTSIVKLAHSETPAPEKAVRKRKTKASN